MLKENLKKIKFIRSLYTEFIEIKRKFKAAYGYKILSKSGLNIIDRVQAKKLVLDRYEITAKSVCHVIGSGYSLNKTKKIINDKDFIIGFNRAALSGLSFNLYFVEIGSDCFEEFSKKQIQLVDDTVSKQTDLIFFKNIWEDKNNINFILENWRNKVYYIKDYLIDCSESEDIKESVKELLSHKSRCLPQLKSTALTAIAFSDYLGFKKIVLHGVDFGGEYFFDADDFDGIKGYYSDPSKSTALYSKASKTSVHETARGDCGINSLLKPLASILKNRDVILYAATKETKSSEVLECYIC
ncbi:MAG: hypothetical protein SCH70_06110 [Candidatus Methanoperedens sp.]|nr:hypothetical protein [Candidatus Methanoperedens sp.]